MHTSSGPVILPGVKALAPGFLIAMPQLGDPNFHRAVVLMLEHSDAGSMGLVLNRTAGITLGELGKDQQMEVSRVRVPQQIFVGGPVEPQRGFVLHDAPDIDERQELMPGLFLSVTLEALGSLLASDRANVRFCLGYAGWGPQQLEQELAQGSWLFAEADPVAVLTTDPAQLWEETVRKMGVDPAMLQPAKGVH